MHTRNAPPRRRPFIASRLRSRALWGTLLWVTLGGASMLFAQNEQATIDFDSDGHPAGTIVETISAIGSSGAIGPIGITGEMPGSTENHAVIFASGTPGTATDLGTPHEDFGGPGVGAAGASGGAAPNDLHQGNLLIVASDLLDLDGDGLVDDPVDGTSSDMRITLDFQEIAHPYTPELVRVLGLKLIDTEGSSPGTVRVLNFNNIELFSAPLTAAGDNGMVTQWLGTPGVGIPAAAKLELVMNGSAAIDDIYLELTPPDPPECYLPHGGDFHVEVEYPLNFGMPITGGAGDRTVTSSGLPEGVTTSPPLPATFPPGEALLIVSWPPSAPVGTYSLPFTVTDVLGQESHCTATVEVDCDLEFEEYGQPEDHEACEWSAHTFHADVHATEEATYQWSFNGTPIPGANSLWFTLTGITMADAGEYAITITNPCGSLTSDPAYLNVKKKPVVEEQPDDLQICKGEELVLHVVASGHGPITYQWTHNGSSIYGETSPTLVVPSVGHHHDGVYELWIWNDCGEVGTAPIHVEVRKKPEIEEQPQDKVRCEGDSVTFTVVASGSEPLEYQWKLDGYPIPGANSASYTIDEVTMADAGEYMVHVENDCGEVYSYPAELNVKKAPKIVDAPQDQAICKGETIYLSVTATGSHPLYYQWKKDGVEIPGETGTTLTIPDAQPSDSGVYTICVENVCDVKEAHANVEVRVAPEIEQHPMGQVLCEGDPLTLTVVATGSHPLHYQWKKDDVAIPGATEATYMVPAVTTDDAGVYKVWVTNDCGEAESDPAEVIVRVAPVITVPPVGQTLCEGETITLTVTATGSDPLEYQWFVDGVEIPGATFPTYTLPNPMAADSGNYSVKVENDCGQVMSDPVPVEVRVAPTIDQDPMDQTLCEGELILLTVVASGSEPLEYQWSVDGVEIPGATDATLSIPNAMASDSGVYTVVVTNDCGMATSNGATVVVRVAPTIVTPPMSQLICAGETLTLMVVASGSEPLSYQWRFNGVDIMGETGPTLMIPNILPSQEGLYDVIVSNDCGMIVSDAANITVGEARTITTQPMPQSICEGDPVTFTVEATGTKPLMYQWRFNGVPIPGANDPSFMIPAVALSDAGNYDVIVSNVCGMETSLPAALTVLVAPTITTPPVGGQGCVGDMFSLTVVASGSAPLSYQWFQDRMPIPGATAATLDLSPLALSDAGNYTVRVSNICGDVTSAPVTVTVLTAPMVTVPPVDQTICVGDPVTFTVTATGSAPLSYQWFQDGVVIPGATMSSLTIPSVDLGDAGNYTVTVTNICGKDTSAAAVLTVAEEPTIVVDSPSTIEICTGDNLTLMTTVTGFPPIMFSWSLNGVPIPGAGSEDFTITNATVGDAGTYQLTATNLCGTVMSSTITVTVFTPPTITTQPVGDDEVCPNEGNSYTFTVVATGNPDRTFQWFFNGEPLVGETDSSLTITNVVNADYGDYTVEVSNVCATITSQVASLVEPVLGFCEAEFNRGDCNADGLLDIADGIYIFRFSFQGVGTPACFDACDHNDDGRVDISDAMFFTTYLFMQTAPPPPPTGECGLDPTPDELECPIFIPCVSP